MKMKILANRYIDWPAAGAGSAIACISYLLYSDDPFKWKPSPRDHGQARIKLRKS